MPTCGFWVTRPDACSPGRFASMTRCGAANMSCLPAFSPTSTALRVPEKRRRVVFWTSSGWTSGWGPTLPWRSATPFFSSMRLPISASGGRPGHPRYWVAPTSSGVRCTLVRIASRSLTDALISSIPKGSNRCSTSRRKPASAAIACGWPRRERLSRSTRT